MTQNFIFKDLKLKIKSDAFIIPIYQQTTGRDIFADLAKMGMSEGNKKIENFSLRTLLDILFAFTYNANNDLAYEDFYQMIPLPYTLNKTFIEKIAELITKELMPETEEVEGDSNQKK